jgi:serine/threonine protein kinase
LTSIPRPVCIWLLNDVVAHPARPEVALLVTEWAEYGSLEQWIGGERERMAGLPRSSRLEEQLASVEQAKTLRRTLEVAMQMLRGLARLHEGLGRDDGDGSHGGGGDLKASAVAGSAGSAGMLVHQDLKPGNVLLFSDFPPVGTLFPHLVKLTDFGLCSDVASESWVGSRVGGTKAYMAPGQALAYVSHAGSESVCPRLRTTCRPLVWW